MPPHSIVLKLRGLKSTPHKMLYKRKGSGSAIIKRMAVAHFKYANGDSIIYVTIGMVARRTILISKLFNKRGLILLSTSILLTFISLSSVFCKYLSNEELCENSKSGVVTFRRKDTIDVGLYIRHLIQHLIGQHKVEVVYRHQSECVGILQRIYLLVGDQEQS